jgi:hypothetical protein
VFPFYDCSNQRIFLNRLEQICLRASGLTSLLRAKLVITVGFGPKVEKRSFKFWRITFESEQSQEALHHGGWFNYKFDDLLKAELASHDSRLRSIARDIKDQQARYDGWKQTHEWGDGLWAVLNKMNEIDNGNAR